MERAKPKPVVLYIRTSREVADAVSVAARAAGESVNQWCITALRATLAVLYGGRYTQPRPLRTSSVGSVESLGSPPAHAIADPTPLGPATVDAVPRCRCFTGDSNTNPLWPCPTCDPANANAIRRLTGFPELKKPIVDSHFLVPRGTEKLPADDIDALLDEVERDLS